VIKIRPKNEENGKVSKCIFVRFVAIILARKKDKKMNSGKNIPSENKHKNR
jgi:hypothetical protein